MISFRHAAFSHVGLVRSGNEDSGYADAHLLVVADGMGGHAAGELASAAVVDAMAAAYRSGKGSMAERLMDALDAGQSKGGDTRGIQSAGLLVVIVDVVRARFAKPRRAAAAPAPARSPGNCSAGRFPNTVTRRLMISTGSSGEWCA